MELQQRFPNNHTLVLSIKGRFDVHTIPQVKATWTSNEDVKYIIFDLEKTEFIDSMGLATLVSGLKAANTRGGKMIVAHPSSVVQTIFDLTSMHRAFDIVPTVQQALEKLGVEA